MFYLKPKNISVDLMIKSIKYKLFLELSSKIQREFWDHALDLNSALNASFLPWTSHINTGT